MMKKNSFIKTLTVNLSYAYLSQIISTLVSICFTLIIPKVLGVEGYGYWQLIVFYATYLGMFYLGVNDGVYLKNGGKTLTEIDKPSISGISKLFFLIHSVLAVLLVLFIPHSVDNTDRQFVLTITAIYLPIINIKGLYGHLLQAVNNTKVYSKSLIYDKIVILFAVILGVVFQINNYRFYVVSYLVGGIVAAGYCCYEAREIIKVRGKPFGKLLPDIKDNIKVGTPLMLSSLTAIMITGITRQIIDMRWDIKDFSKISLSLTMMNFVLVFLNQSSLVLFPAIRKIQSKSQIELYAFVNKCLNIVLPIVFIFYVPIGSLLGMWLPNYAESVKFLGILLPICIFDGKMNLINNTYYKVLRMERNLFAINVITFAVNLIFSLISAYVFENINFMAYGLLFSIVFRSVLSELLLNKRTNNHGDYTMFIPVSLSVIYIVFNVVLPKWHSFGAYCVVLVIMLLTMKTKLSENFKGLKSVLQQANKTVGEI